MFRILSFETKNQQMDFLKTTPSQKFHKGTKLYKLPKETDPKNWPETWKKSYYKGYPRFPAIILPKSILNSKYSLKKALINKKSIRNYSQRPLSANELSSLLYYSAGIRKKESRETGRRFYPSAGARYPLEIYPVILNVDKIRDGIYHYYLKSHCLETILGEPFRIELFKNFTHGWINKAAVLFITTAIFYRTEVKYGDRGYRHVLTEVGHLSQNLYLISAALGLGCCSIGGYIDDGINRLLDLDGQEESVIGVTAVGHPR